MKLFRIKLFFINLKYSILRPYFRVINKINLFFLYLFFPNQYQRLKEIDKQIKKNIEEMAKPVFKIKP